MQNPTTPKPYLSLTLYKMISQLFAWDIITYKTFDKSINNTDYKTIPIINPNTMTLTTPIQEKLEKLGYIIVPTDTTYSYKLVYRIYKLSTLTLSEKQTIQSMYIPLLVEHDDFYSSNPASSTLYEQRVTIPETLFTLINREIALERYNLVHDKKCSYKSPYNISSYNSLYLDELEFLKINDCTLTTWQLIYYLLESKQYNMTNIDLNANTQIVIKRESPLYIVTGFDTVVNECITPSIYYDYDIALEHAYQILDEDVNEQSNDSNERYYDVYENDPKTGFSANFDGTLTVNIYIK